jgi:hypothetical protein
MPKTSHLFVQNTAKRLRLAYLDWNLCPLATIREELGCNYGHIGDMRKHHDYIEEFKALKDAWQEKIRALPGTNDVAKTIEYGLASSVKALVHRVAEKKISTRDLIASCRVLAQMDGRFLGHLRWGGEEEESVAGDDRESIAQELAQILKRRESVQ